MYNELLAGMMSENSIGGGMKAMPTTSTSGTGEIGTNLTNRTSGDISLGGIQLAPARPGQWIAGIDNNLVVLAAGGLLFLMATRRKGKR